MAQATKTRVKRTDLPYEVREKNGDYRISLRYGDPNSERKVPVLVQAFFKDKRVGINPFSVRLKDGQVALNPIIKKVEGNTSSVYCNLLINGKKNFSFRKKRRNCLNQPNIIS